MKKILILFAIIFLVFEFSSAQQPINRKLYSIKNDKVKIIFNDSIKNDALRIAEGFNLLKKFDSPGLSPKKVRRLPVFLNSTSTISNGYATLSPYMTMFYPMPMTDYSLSSNEWYANLMIHEYRHILQFQTLNKGFLKVFGIFAGSLGRNFLSYSVPQWFFEGDAVYTETILSNQGRGRVADFDKMYRALILEKNAYSYDKAMLGSFKDNVPDHYRLGYLMVTNARNNYGNNIFDSAISRFSCFPFFPWSFSWGFKSYSGIGFNKLYKQTVSDLANVYQTQQNNLEITSSSKINNQKRECYSSYLSPKFYNDSSFLCIKTSLKRPTSLIFLDKNGNENTVCQMDNTIFDYAFSKIFYISERPHPKYSLRDYLDIAVYDLNSKKRYYLSKKQRFTSLAVDINQRRLLCTQVNEKRISSLVIFTYEDKSKISLSKNKEIAFCEGELIRFPKFFKDDRIVYVSNFKNQNSLQIIDIKTLEKQILIPYTDDMISCLEVLDNQILYVSDFRGNSSVYSFQIDSNIIRCIASKKYAIESLCVSDKKDAIIFSNFTKNGYDIEYQILKPFSYSNLEDIKDCRIFYPKVKENFFKLDTLASIKANPEDFKIRRYCHFYDPIRIYGAAPSLTSKQLSYTLYSLNTTQTIESQYTFTYDYKANYYRNLVLLTYVGLYPEFTLYYDFGQNADYRSSYEILNPFGVNFAYKYYYFNENVFALTCKIPFNLSRFYYSSNLNFVLDFANYSIKNRDYIATNSLSNGNFAALTYGFDYSIFKAGASRDFASRLGFSANLSKTQTFSKDRDAYQIVAGAKICLPGFAAQHALHAKVAAIYQSHSIDVNRLYLFDNQNFLWDGYDIPRMQDFFKYSLVYHFPICYPDGGIPGVMYIKRLRANVNAHYANGSLLKQYFDFSSVGGEILFDFHLFRVSTMISLGFGYNYLLKNNIFSNSSDALYFSLNYQL